MLSTNQSDEILQENNIYLPAYEGCLLYCHGVFTWGIFYNEKNIFRL